MWVSKHLRAAVAVLLLSATPASAQVWTVPRTWNTGELVTASIMNSAIRDNLSVLRAGGLAVSSQAIGDLLCASSTTQFSRLAAVATGQLLVSTGTGACPAYTTTLSNANTPTLTVKQSSGNGPLIELKNFTTTTKYNWFLGNNYNGSDTFELIPSMAVDGDTPSATSMLSLTRTGLLTVAGAGTHAFSGTASALVVGGSSVTSDWATTPAIQLQAGSSTYGTISIASSRTDGSGTRVSDLAFETLTNNSTYRTIAMIEASTAGATANKRGGTLGFYTQANNTVGPSLRWGINENGDHTFGASNHIADSSGTPTLTTCTNCGASPTITGSDYAFVLDCPNCSGSNITVTVTFGHTWTSTPVCISSQSLGGAFNTAGTASTTALTSMVSSSAAFAGAKYVFLCRGY